MNISSTDDVCDGNWRPLNSRHTEDCHIQPYSNVCHGTHIDLNALPTTAFAVLADTLPHAFFPRDKRDHVYIQKYVSVSVQGWNASK